MEGKERVEASSKEEDGDKGRKKRHNEGSKRKRSERARGKVR